MFRWNENVSQVSSIVLLQTAQSWANAGVLLDGRMHRERGASFFFGVRIMLGTI